MKLKFAVLATLSVLLYLFLHLSNLTSLPVFADESIYIRWAQLIIENGGDFWFFPLNDGKTPLFMWLMVPFQKWLSDPLFAGRLVSVLAGVWQVLVMALIVKALGGKRLGQVLAMLFTIILPFWFFHFHLALIDGLLVVWLTTALWGGIKAVKKIGRRRWLWLGFMGVSFGLALLTKVSAVVFLPVLLALPLLRQKANREQRGILLLQVGLAIGLGFIMFLLLKLHPAFGQLFSRGGDFLFPLSQVLSEGLWWKNLANVPSYAEYFWQYMTPGLCVVMIAGLFVPKNTRTIHWLFWAGVLFVLPIAVMGKVVYARYLFPATILFTLSAVFSFEYFLKSAKSSAHYEKRVIVSTALAVVLAHILTFSLHFMTSLLTNPDGTPFVSSDRQQYLTEWSSGHGIKETVDFLQAESADKKIAVATEGFFGTLPDGVLMYLHQTDVTNIWVEGIGVPVFGLPDAFIEKARSYDEVWLVVNSHRLNMELPPENLLQEYCRPYAAPCLQVWDVTFLVHTSQN